MATFKTQIEDLIGSVGDDTLISQSLQDIGGEIISSLPDLKLIPVAKTTAISSSGLSVADKKILGVDKSDLKARFVPAVHKAKYNDTASIFAATDTDPVYYLEDEKVYVNGAAGSGATSGHLHYVPLLPTSDGSTLIAHGDSSVANFPLEAQQLLVLGSAVRCLQRLLSDKTSSLPSDISAPSLPVAPSSPSAPSFTYTDASVSDIVQPLVSVSDMAALTESAPSYVPPSLTLGAAPTISDLNIVAVAPSIPTLSSNSVTFSIDAPVYTPPVIHIRSSLLLNMFELAGAKIQEINSQIAEYQANIQNELNKFNDANVEYQAKLQVALKDSDLSQADDSQLIQKFQSEIQLYQANVAKEVQQYQQNLEADLRVWQAERSTDLQKYSTDIQNELNSFNESNVVYQQDIQRKSQNFQKDIQVAIQNAQQEFNTRKSILDKDVQLELQNAINNFQKEVQEYGSTLSKYQADNQKYQAEVGSTMQKYSSDVSNYGAKIQKQSIDYQWKQGQYSQLKSEYNQGLQILISGGIPQQQGA
jgi:hypothetical protein